MGRSGDGAFGEPSGVWLLPMRVGDVSRHRTVFVGAYRHLIALLHGHYLARARRHRAAFVGNSDPSLEDDHRIVNGHGLLQGLVRTVSSEPDSYRTAMTLVEEIAGKDVPILPWRAFHWCVGNGELVNGHKCLLRDGILHTPARR